jgi:hypothetical protein
MPNRLTFIKGLIAATPPGPATTLKMLGGPAIVWCLGALGYACSQDARKGSECRITSLVSD